MRWDSPDHQHVPIYCPSQEGVFSEFLKILEVVRRFICVLFRSGFVKGLPGTQEPHMLRVRLPG